MVYTPEAFRLIQIIINGVEVDARPIAWNEPDTDGTGRNKEGESIQAVEYITTCPHCSQGLQFHGIDIVVIGGIYYVKCTSCGAGDMTANEDHREDPYYIEYNEIPFIDPIEAGILVIDRMVN